MYTEISTQDELDSYIKNEEAVLVYVSTTNCNVCKVLKPKIAELFAEKFPKVKLLYVNSDNTPEISGQLSIFAVPTILIYLDGQEFVRESRNISIDILAQKVERPYNLFFE